MIVADLLEFDPKTKARLDYLDFAQRLEQELRAKHEDAQFEIQIVGFAKQIGDIAEGAKRAWCNFSCWPSCSPPRPSTPTRVPGS